MSTELGRQVSIAAAWESYQAEVLRGAPDIQHSEYRLAFWAGAATLFYAIMKHGLDPGEEPTDADVAHMAAIEAEIHRFAETFDAEVMKRRGNLST
jgi:hypothetical protein